MNTSATRQSASGAWRVGGGEGAAEAFMRGAVWARAQVGRIDFGLSPYFPRAPAENPLPREGERAG